MRLSQDHVVGGGVAVVITSNLPAVLGWWQGADAPVTAETALIVTIGAALYAGLRLVMPWKRVAGHRAHPITEPPTADPAPPAAA